MLGFVLPLLLLLGTPAVAVEFKGQNIDGQKLPARAYYYATGGVYKVQVSFHNKRATIYFEDGNQTTIQLNQQVITDSNNIEGFGKLGQYPVSNIFSVGLVYDNDWFNSSSGQLQPSNPLDGLWRISLE
ncbi:MAG: hypothetical protein RMZ41_004325 [Nostoc sp. DedVER02]|uniref:hypothetical protein n=1 Tax=unclassified Nostoc TaxID=2593658 RepID=UPI002AD31AB2|nr:MULTISPECIES: hypothetical protein [unclassified Nostoc]MDZ7990230.1 hypothetical protein [Nostoc sp. DedVER02]MDZ8116712.1 hypothetical protein [Nostoc sp. DedVER01b]